MSELPTTNDSPLLIPSQVRQVQPDTPDLSNPYMYPANPAPDGDTREEVVRQHTASVMGDPELQKIKSSFWKTAGRLQSAIGSMTGLESWQTSGHKTKEEAEREYREAEERLNGGEASRLHGEYDRLMGYVTYAVGHVSGDPELQSKANERAQQGEEEIGKFNHR
ncbi:uncharacterized protein EV154DRAFT_496911 [Mucor mucedo]|uniref:Uncharacterized protein n=1 Tax=Mucor saturninus TaxID=64648 RepID=A0A8H7RFH0_9FUNG|nr:uncharacterized protein EV154DRAFT_496911 [Mucor mucedo]KAG2210464.1 hypothetical protein INT47_002406 [Mucor saturninus]KAI7895083.1 hypothetical protein EV154DRAFT_496911 [Mucor mucedo]